MLNLTEEQVLQLAPDTASAKAGSQLAVNSKWTKKSSHELALWGYCQGSGKDPYLTMVDVTNIAFKCSCPSRKFPCKHGIGLLLLYARDKNGFVSEQMIDKVDEWIGKRNEKEQKKEEKAEKEARTPKTEKEIASAQEATNKRAEARERKVKDGVEELRSWIRDHVRTGMMNLPSNAGQFQLNMAARLVDAQAGGLAGMVRSLGEINMFQDGWQLEVLKQLSRIYLFTESFRKEEMLEPEFAREIRTIIGWNVGKEEVLASPAVSDKWLVLSRRTQQEEQMTSEQIWMYGLTQHRYAVILNFYFGGQLPQHLFSPGLVIEADVCYYPSVIPQRVLVKEQKATHEFLEPPARSGFSQVLNEISDAMAKMPLLYRAPFMVEPVQLVPDGKNWILKDKDNLAIVLNNTEEEYWKVLAWSGGKTFSVFLIYEAGNWRMDAVWSEEKFVSLT